MEHSNKNCYNHNEHNYETEQKHKCCHNEHEHHHGHGHHHHNLENMSSSKLLWVTLLNFSITVVQFVGGIISNSLSLVSDAFHNLGDSSAIFIAFLAGKRSTKSADEQHTFGYTRIEILAALFNSIVLIVICIFLFVEAFERLLNPQPIKGLLMLLIATFGLLANLISVIILNKDKEHNLNVKAAYLHLMGDTLSSVAVILGGLAIWKFNIFWIDPVITILVGIYIIHHTWGVVKQTVDILMQATPKNIDVKSLKKEVENLSEVDNIHHLHIWKLNDKQTNLEAHINLKNNITMKEMMSVRHKIEEILQHEYYIQHTTLQIGYDCCKGKSKLISNS